MSDPAVPASPPGAAGAPADTIDPAHAARVALGVYAGECRLTMENGRLTAHPPGRPAVAVRVVRATPCSAPGGALAALDQRKREVWWWGSLAELDAASRALAETALGERYHEPEITRIAAVEPMAGGWHWTVDTSVGPRRFVLRSPERNLVEEDDGRLLLRDVLGSRYRITRWQDLDVPSRAQLGRIR